ncbi:mesoderm posterior protein 1 [Phodopus roborovskii]|uniref:Mesp1 protein n=1 Tax=Phodopus roborovskii TaxID=109678 RepID=A0AAV0A6T3_PHORO|nr:mesoderm posterior protein 1 [Phodopus roborovskii]CAH7340562.1 Mesp1 [Phodopus roborovskii]
MAQPLCAPLAQSWIPGPARRPPLMPSDGDSVCSPAWSSDPWDGAQAGSPAPSCARPARRAGIPGRRGSHGSRLGSGQRQSASEREKLRMRTLARALHELRRFLPPSVAPTGQSLTKIETLRLAIRYIGHLSAVLGLSEDSLRRQRHADAASPRACPLCPDGGPAQAQAQPLGLHLRPAACSGVSWGSPPACPRPRDIAEPWDPSFPYAGTDTTSLERQEMEPSPSPPLFSSDVLALLETWTPQEWPPA